MKRWTIVKTRQSEQFTRLVEEIITLFDTNLVLSVHVFTLDKDEYLKVEDMVDPLSGTHSVLRTKRNKRGN